MPITCKTITEPAEKMNITKNIQFKFFKVTFYKKGTCHITFTDKRIEEICFGICEGMRGRDEKRSGGRDPFR